jgi:hypothetical protein
LLSHGRARRPAVDAQDGLKALLDLCACRVIAEVDGRVVVAVDRRRDAVQIALGVVAVLDIVAAGLGLRAATGIVDGQALAVTAVSPGSG